MPRAARPICRVRGYVQACSAVVLGLLALVPACAFWDMSDWSDRASASSDAGGCSRDGGAALFCDDFETPRIAWSDAEICDGCSIGVVPDVTHGAPSPPTVFFSESTTAAKLGGGEAHLIQYIDGVFDAATLHFSLYVDRPDPATEAAVQELGLRMDSTHLVRARLWISGTTLRLNTAVDAPELAGTSYDDPAQPALSPGEWHRFAITIAATPTPTITFVMDGATVLDRHAILDGEHVAPPFSNVVLRNGIHYLGETSTVPWRILVDDVSITTP